MFSLKRFVEDFLAEILRIPLMYLRSNALLVWRGARGAYALERTSTRNSIDLLSLRAIAIVNVLLIFALVRVTQSKPGEGFDSFVEAVFKPDSLLSPQLSRCLATIVVLYSMYYLLVSPFSSSSSRSHLFASISVYFSSLALLVYGVCTLVGLSAGDWCVRPVLRLIIVASYIYCFWHIGNALRFSLKPFVRKNRHMVALVAGVLCFGLYLIVVVTFLSATTREIVWPNFSL
jgi:hypothetical protein